MSRPVPGSPLYAILTVRRVDAAAPATDREAYAEIKAALKLESPAIDDAYGAMPVAKAAPFLSGQGRDAYLVLVNLDDARRLADEKHPSVLGLFHAAVVPSGCGPKAMDPAQLEEIDRQRRRRRPGGPGF